MVTKKNEVLNAKVKADGRKIQVYKIKNTETFNIYLGDKISMDRVTNGEHNETFTADQLEFI